MASWIDLPSYRYGDARIAEVALPRTVTASGGFPTFAPRLSDDKVAPIPAIHEAAVKPYILSKAAARRPRNLTRL